MGRKKSAVFLRQPCEGGSFGQDISDILMVLLDRALLPGGAGIAEEDTRQPLSAYQGKFYALGVGELCPVVSQDHFKQTGEFQIP